MSPPNQSTPELIRLRDQNPKSFLKLLHSILVDCQPTFYSMLVSKGYDMFAKKDVQFVQTICRMLQREFTIRPTMTPDQFFTTGFFEAKIELLITCGGLVKNSMPPKKRQERKKQTLDNPQDHFGQEEPENEEIEVSEIKRPHNFPQSYSSNFNTAEIQQSQKPPQFIRHEFMTENKGYTEKPRNIGPLKRDDESDDKYENTYSNSNGVDLKTIYPNTQSIKYIQSTPDIKDKLIEDQRVFIQELKSLIMITNENLQILTTKMSQFGTEVSSKIESMEARIRVLEAVTIMQRDSSPVYGLDG